LSRKTDDDPGAIAKSHCILSFFKMPDENEMLPRQTVLLLSQVDELSLWHAVTRFAHRHQEQFQDDNDNAIIDTMEALEHVFVQSIASPSFVQRLAEQEYFPWLVYYQSLYQQQLHTLLQEYPQQCPKVSSELIQVCRMLQRLQASESRLLKHFGIHDRKTCRVVRELMRPWVERLQFHFVTHDPDRPTTFKTERLTKWLFQYVQTHVFESGVWEFVQLVLGQDSVQFLEELVQLLQYVVTERNMFRDAPEPILMKHVEQLFLFDAKMQDLGGPVRRLVDVFVVGDDELWDWWLQNEQQVALWETF
jgi:hypothetical protein